MKRMISSAKPLATSITLLGTMWSHVPNAFDWIDIVSQTRAAIVSEERQQ